MNNSPKHSQLIKLRKILDERFSESDLRTLCFDLHVDYQNLPGEGKADKARELVEYLDHRDRIIELVIIIREARPDIPLGDVPVPEPYPPHRATKSAVHVNIDQRVSGKIKFESVVVMVLGLAFILFLVILAVAFPNPTQFQYIVFRVILSLAAAGIGAAIPGFINVKLSLQQNVLVRATGALAVFVIVYFLNPAQIGVALTPTPMPTSQQSSDSLIGYVSDTITPSALGKFESKWPRTNYARQYFVGGAMLWADNPDGSNCIWVVNNGGLQKEGYNWARYEDKWTSADPVVPTDCAGVEQEKRPMMGFGKVWCENEPVRRAIGLPLQGEFGSNDATIEFYSKGVLFFIPADKQLWVLLYDGKWYTIEVRQTK